VTSISSLSFGLVVIIGVVVVSLMLPTVVQNLSASDLNATGPAASAIDALPTIFALLAVVVAVAGILLVVNR